MTVKKLNHIFILLLSTYACVCESSPSSLNIAARRTSAFLLHICLLHTKASGEWMYECLSLVGIYSVYNTDNDISRFSYLAEMVSNSRSFQKVHKI